jgi:ABC-type nitrate/sulfonate/bicarbonate transport system substrate-binding protein
MRLHRSRFIAMLAAPALAYAGPVRAQPVKLRLAAVPSDSYAEPYDGLDGGFFARAGLDVEVTSFGSGGQITTALAGGAIDIGIADPIQVGAGFLHGTGFGYFAGGMEYTTNAPTTQLCISKTGPVKSVKDLAGQTIGVFGLNSMPMFATREWLSANGVDADGVKFVELPPSAMLPAIARGTVAAGVVTEPQISGAADLGCTPFAKVYDYCAKSFYINSWFAKRDWLAKNGETARKFVQETARWANTHHAESLPILAKYTKMEPDKLSKMTRAVFDTALDPKKVQPPLTLAAKYHLLDRPLNADELIVKL